MVLNNKALQNHASIELWHCRLGHPSRQRMKSFSLMESAIPSLFLSDCETCHLAKQKRLSFPVSVSASKSVFDLIHLDVWGPFPIKSIYGHVFFSYHYKDSVSDSVVFPFQDKDSVCESFGVTEDVLKRNNGRMTKRNPVNVFPNIVVSDSVQSNLHESLPAHEQTVSMHGQSPLAQQTASIHEQLSQEQNFQTSSSSTHEQTSNEQNFQKASQIALPIDHRDKSSFLRNLRTTIAEVLKEPKNYNQTIKNDCWKVAMEEEIQALERNNTWDLVPLPPGKKTIGCKWVYKTKLKADGTLERYKARSNEGINLSQRKYTLDLVSEYGFLESKPASTPIVPLKKSSTAVGNSTGNAHLHVTSSEVFGLELLQYSSYRLRTTAPSYAFAWFLCSLL
ncbi:hypothetical protein GQ457_08G017410 [Hibiscus cannabinus]